MRIGIISAYQKDDWHAQQIAAVAERSAEVEIVEPSDFDIEVTNGESGLRCANRDALDYDLFLTPRPLGDGGHADFQLDFYELLANSGAPMVNEVKALLAAIDKFKSSWAFQQAGLPGPRVVVSQKPARALEALDQMGRVVVKPLYGSLGDGIEMLHSDRARDRERLVERVADEGAVYLQQYVETPIADVRAFVVGGRVEAAVARRPVEGEFRSNLELGADAQPITLSPAAEWVAVAAARAVGLDYSGVDLLITKGGPLVLEVNGTPSFKFLYEATGSNMAEPIVAHALNRARIRALSGGTAIHGH